MAAPVENYVSHAAMFAAKNSPIYTEKESTIIKENPPPPPLQPSPPTSSYADVLRQSTSYQHVNTSNLILNKNDISVPDLDTTKDQNKIAGTYHAVKIDSALYRKRLMLCQHSLIARLILNRGDQPWNCSKLKEKLSSLWHINSWRLISLGKGYYHVLLSSRQDQEAIWGQGPLFLKPGILRLQQRTPGFDPYKEKSTST